MAIIPYCFPTFYERITVQPFDAARASRVSAGPSAKTVFVVCASNQLLTDVLSIIFYKLGGWTPNFKQTVTLTPLPLMLVHIVLCMMCREFLFYYLHRLAHHPRLYGHVHKWHHGFTVPSAISGQYSHPLEHLFINLLPLAVPAQMLHVHLTTFWILLTMTLTDSVTTHSGISWPLWILNREQVHHHDEHHRRFEGNYGMKIIDRMHGTVYGEMKKKNQHKQVEAKKED